MSTSLQFELVSGSLPLNSEVEEGRPLYGDAGRPQLGSNPGSEVFATGQPRRVESPDCSRVWALETWLKPGPEDGAWGKCQQSQHKSHVPTQDY